MTTKIKTATRWLIRRDYPEVLDIDRRTHETAWCEEEFICCLRQRNCIGMVVEQGRRIVGFMVYELHQGQLCLLRLAVHPEDQRCGIGTVMIDNLKKKLIQHKRNQITFILRDDQLAGQLFLSANEFRCRGTIREHFDDRADGYEFAFCLPKGGGA